MVSLRRLQHFVVLSEEQAISRAARRLHLTQPALTRSIQTLEDALGLSLFERRHDGVSLSSAGQAMLMRAKQMLAAAQAMQTEAQLIRGVEIGQVRFGVGVLPASIFLSEVLTRQVASKPQLLVHVDIESWVRLHEKLLRGDLDFVVAMTRSLPPDADHALISLPAQHLGYFVRAGHPLLQLPRRQLRTQLQRYPLLCAHMPSRAMDLTADIFGLPAGSEVPGLRCDNAQVLKRVALGTDGIVLSTRENLQQELASGQLCLLPVMRERDSLLELSLIHARSRVLSPAARWLMTVIQEHFARPVTGTTG